jgi:hypothetical protein
LKEKKNKRVDYFGLRAKLKKINSIKTLKGKTNKRMRKQTRKKKYTQSKKEGKKILVNWG